MTYNGRAAGFSSQEKVIEEDVPDDDDIATFVDDGDEGQL